jgi:hypothetical protein
VCRIGKEGGSKKDEVRFAHLDWPTSATQAQLPLLCSQAASGDSEIERLIKQTESEIKSLDSRTGRQRAGPSAVRFRFVRSSCSSFLLLLESSVVALLIRGVFPLLFAG